MNAVSQVIDRVIEVVREETEGLRADAAFDVHASSLRKHRLLLDLHHLPPGRAQPERLEALQTALAENRTEIAARLEVAERVAAIAVAVVREDGADGTYRANEGRANEARADEPAAPSVLREGTGG